MSESWHRRLGRSESFPAGTMTEYRVPRNFKLLDELECAEKGKFPGLPSDTNFVTLGLARPDDTMLTT